ncbi:histone-lysine N-methyltransferase SETMAR-like [Nylanderia fulva]|uniref:histone-lysine N-methyltransferase SETMAR-like n=1 Tax=Nylanderia fulva TaxID=613905 RepID=UPI0010FAD7A2|nr:histone-lysine N-methyltransferase SETMAR-like [Nylanderia fulva]
MGLGIDHKTVLNHLHKAGYKKKLDVWVPHELSAKNMIDRINICDALLKRNEIEPFLKRVITAVTSVHEAKIDAEIDSQLYCEQLERLRQAIERKRPELINRKDVVFHHDNARPHTSLMTRQKLRELGWEVLMHPPYSPDIAPSDYHLFRSLQNFLNGIKLLSKEACENNLIQFFNQKSQKFFTDSIMALPEKWRNIVDNNGTYLV